MSASPPLLRSDRTLEEAQKLMTENALVAVPVVNPAGVIMGVLSDLGLLKCFLKRSQATPNLIFVGNYATEFEKIQTIAEDEAITEAFRRMLSSASKRIFVLRENEIVGRLEPSDLYDFMASRSTGRRFKGDLDDEKKKVRLPRTTATEAAIFQASLFRDSPCPIYACDLSGVIIAANRMLHFILDYNDGELVGQTLRELYPVTSHQGLFEGLDRLIVSGFRPGSNVAMVKKDTQLLKIDVVSLLKYDQDGVPHSVITVGRLEDEAAMNEILSHVSVTWRPKVAPPGKK